MSVVFRLAGARDTLAAIKGMTERAANPTRAFKFIGEAELTRNAHNIAAGRDTDGKPFKQSRRAAAGGGQTMLNRGEMASSINYVASADSLDFDSSSRAAAVHYDGLEIKGRPWLTIPLRAKGGVFAGVTLDISKNRTGARARHFKNTFFARRGGKLFLFQKVGAHQVRALFILVRSVKMPVRKWMGVDLNRAAEVLGRHVVGERLK